MTASTTSSKSTADQIEPTSPNSPSPPPRQGARQPPSSRPLGLARGEACLTCRKKKLRCDAGKPACDKCLATGRGSRCEYQDTKYLTAIAALEDQVRTLQARLTELEVSSRLALDGMNLVVSQDNDSNGLPLEWPYDPSVLLQPQQPAQESNGSRASAIAIELAGDPTAQTQLEAATAHFLLGIFQQHATQFAVPSRAILRLTASPLPALLEAALALGAHFAPAASSPDHPSPTSVTRSEWGMLVPPLLVRAEHLLSAYDARAPGSHALALVQTLAILASLYYIRSRPVDGHRCAGGAWRLSRALGLDSTQVISNPEDAIEREQTWTMVQSIDWIWSGICHMPSERPPSNELIQGSVENFSRDALLLTIRILHSRAQVIICTLRQHPGGINPASPWWMENFRPCLRALERLSGVANLGYVEFDSLQTRLAADGAIATLNFRAGFHDIAEAGAAGVVQLLEAQKVTRDWTTVDPLVAYYLTQMEHILNGSPAAGTILRDILDALSPIMPFINTLRQVSPGSVSR